MGYTHYFSNVRLTPALAAATTKIVAASPATVRGWDGTGAPVVTETLISFNGDEAAGEDCETFLLEPAPQHDYQGCKTNSQPYDVVVVAILVAAFAQEQTGVGSDGGWEDWLPGIGLYEAACGPLPEQVKDALFLHLTGIQAEPLAAQ